MASGLTIPPISEKLSTLGLDNNYTVTESAPNILGEPWNVKEGLKIYFLTIRLRVSISHEVVMELVTCLRAHKHYKQMLLCVEKENATGPCTHHVHAIVHFKVNVPKSTFQMWVDRFIGKHYMKDEGVVKHDYNR